MPGLVALAAGKGRVGKTDEEVDAVSVRDHVTDDVTKLLTFPVGVRLHIRS